MNFKHFVQEKYMEHRDECKWYNIPCKYAGLNAYFNKNKWFLKKQYKNYKKNLL